MQLRRTDRGFADRGLGLARLPGREGGKGQQHGCNPVSLLINFTRSLFQQNFAMADRLVGLSMLVAATAVFVYYTVWTLFMPFVDDDHILHSLFLPRVWAIRIPVILLILGTTVVGSFVSVVMIKSNRKKALKAQQKKAS
ncbi:dolichol phosphate-mannose biosynthesis regulatory protein-domain-containing protein [Bipolaris maydis]|nr:dolichol phosphate-mannose biosynthesis regulatory protein-domain-containing protein [Bipolaris maydis]